MAAMARFSLSPSLRDSAVLLARVRPQIHSTAARPTKVIAPEFGVTPKQCVVVGVPHLQFDEKMKRYFKHQGQLLAFDAGLELKEGDTLLIQKMAKPFLPTVQYEVLKLVHKYGDIQDPLTGEAVAGHEYRSHMEAVAKIYGGAGKFDYQKAPKRGRLEGQQDFTDKVTYYRWHRFEQTDGYSLIS